MAPLWYRRPLLSHARVLRVIISVDLSLAYILRAAAFGKWSWLPLGLSGAFHLFILDCIFRWWCSVDVLLFGYPCDGGPTTGAQIGGGYDSDLRSGDSRWANRILAVKIAWYW